MKSMIRISVVIASVLLLAATVGHTQNRPPCFDDQGNPLFSNPGGCFSGSDFQWMHITDFEEILVVDLRSDTRWLRANEEGEWFLHVRQPTAKVFFCNPAFAEECAGRRDNADPFAPDFAYTGELVGTASVTMNSACLGSDVDCAFWCPASGVISGEVFSESGTAYNLSGGFVLAPSNDPNHLNFGKCKIVLLDFKVQ